ncbi:hypothetical protein DEJ50_05430 [Streptomyces venezuelae]|uniref:Uncharacterized protein n=1 Tax=Streptomyces venezuelae TaxID=54571 RepID=A0A5P2D1X2_STRVZ|nr:hypothetical protein [Streptomyces venezuelae]QES47351.1 hypothetical protein DEJ50_05430 [Streptomyces venezuelae]
MLEQELATVAAVAAAGGTAVVQAAGTSAWEGLRHGVARWFGRGDAEREQAALDNLDRTASALETAREAEGAQAEQVRRDQAVVWQTRIEARLEDLRGSEQTVAHEELAALLTGRAPQGGPTAGPGGLAVSGGLGGIHAHDSATAAGVINGGVHITRPPQPDPSQG